MLDAQTLFNGRLIRIQLLAGALLVVGTVIIAAVGGGFVGWIFAIVAVVAVAATFTEIPQRWLLARNARSLLGKRVDVTIGRDNLRFSSELATTDVPWSSLTAVLSNVRTVVFVRDRFHFGYLPASAFDSATDMARFTRFAQERVASASRVSDG